MKIEGRVWVFGDHVDTDLIIPARYLNLSDLEELAAHCFEDLRPDLADHVRPDDIVVAGVNFGCGSSREQAPLAMKTLGFGAVVARSFARIFYRNAINIGFPILECEEAVDGFQEGDRARIDLSSGSIAASSLEKHFQARPIPDFMRAILKDGGLVNHLKRSRFNTSDPASDAYEQVG